MAHFQPFLISEFKSGLFNYLEPWIRPTDAFDPLENAYAYRGAIYKRNGMRPFGAPIPFGPFQIATGDGVTKVFTGTLPAAPVTVGSLVVTDSVETFRDNGDGTLFSNLGGTGTLNYATGAYVLNFNTAPLSLSSITATYSIQNSRISYEDFLVTGNGGTSYSGTLQTIPIIPGSFNPSNGVESFTDDALGVLTGSLGGTGTINYTSGAWTLNFNALFSPPVNVYATYNPASTTTRPIMGVKQWTDEGTDNAHLVVMDTRRASIYDDNTNTFLPLNTISQTLWIDDGSTTSITLNVGFSNISPYTRALTPYTVTISYPSNTTTDNGSGGFAGAGVIQNTTTVNYATGAIQLNLSANSAGRVFMVTATLAGDYFHGDSSAFFNTANWQGFLYMTNNVDRITLFDGTNLSRPPFPITLAHQTAFVNDITTCLEIDVYKNRFLVQRPTLVGSGTPSGQSIRWSAINNPTNLVADVTGNGGELSAPTDDFIQASHYLRDFFIVFFTNTVWTFRFTGSDFAPFRWDKINSTKSTNAPYAGIEYDERITAIGYKGLIASDGVNVQRYDLNIIDEFLNINQNRLQQCYGIRFDNINQSWMLYPDAETNAFLSNKALIYNFLETSWSIYDLTMSCLGLYFVTQDRRWIDFAAGGPYPDNWEDVEQSWNSYVLKARAPTLLGGGQDGVVYQMNDGDSDNGMPINASLTSTRWNPFVGSGQKVQFGHIDFYYQVFNRTEATLTFFVDNSDSPAAQRTLSMDGPVSSNYAMKRVYINAVGEFLQMNLQNNQTAGFKIIGMVLWARPAGRLTP